MRLLNVIRSVDPRHGGPAEGLRQSVAATAALGHVEEVLTLDGPDQPGVRSFPAVMHALGPVASTYGFTARLVPWLRERAPDYDAVVVHGLWQYHGLAVRHALRRQAVPYFVYPHGMLDPWFGHRYPLKHLKKRLYWPWGEYRVLRDAAAVLFTAREEERLAAQSFSRYRVKGAVVGYGIALDESSRATTAEPFLARWPEARDKRIVLFLGRLHPKKGCDLLIDAFAQVAPREPRLHLVVAGPDGVPGERTRLQALARRLGIASRITWPGMLSGEAKWSALQAAEVFALPSHQENFGVAVVEALALGLPVIVSDKVNIWREIECAGAGYVGSDTAEATAASLRRWLALGPDERIAMTVAARACYERSFTMRSSAERLLDAIRLRLPPAPVSRMRDAIHGGATKPP